MTRLRICYVLATAAAGTGYHAAMLADGADARGMSVAVFGPPATLTQFFPGAQGTADPDAADGPVAPEPDAPGLAAGPGRGIRFGTVEIADRPRPGHGAARCAW